MAHLRNLFFGTDAARLHTAQLLTISLQGMLFGALLVHTSPRAFAVAIVGGAICALLLMLRKDRS